MTAKNSKSQVAIWLLTIGLLATATVGCTSDSSDSKAPSKDGTPSEQNEQSDASNNGTPTAVNDALTNVVLSISDVRDGDGKAFSATCDALDDAVTEAKKSPSIPDEKAEETWREALDRAAESVPLCEKLTETKAEADFIEMSESISASMTKLTELHEQITASGYTTTTPSTEPEG